MSANLCGAEYEKVVAGCPCDGCANRERCASEKLACSAFGYWTNGVKRKRKPTGSQVENQPNRAVFMQIFNRQDNLAAR